MSSEGQKTYVNAVTFDELPPLRPTFAGGGANNLGLILDVNVPVTVSIGTVRKTIAEILALGPGHVVKLDRLAGEPVDLEVNGKLIARGEVVVVDEKYGIRITEIVAPAERLATSS